MAQQTSPSSCSLQESAGLSLGGWHAHPRCLGLLAPTKFPWREDRVPALPCLSGLGQEGEGPAACSPTPRAGMVVLPASIPLPLV